MEYPQNPTQPFRIETVAPPLVTVIALSMIQPLVVISTTAWPMQWSDAPWRLRVFSLLLGTAPQIAVGLTVLAAVALFAEYYRAVRWSSMIALAIGVLMAPLLIFHMLDSIQVFGMIPTAQSQAYKLSVAQTSGMGVLLAPALIWFGLRGIKAGRKAPVMDITDALLIDKEPIPGKLDPRVTN